MGLLSALLASISQIYFVNRPLAGLLITLGVFWASPYMGLAMLIATLSGVLAAHFLKYDPELQAEGCYGFNAALVGLSLALFAPPSAGMLVAAAVVGAVSCPLYYLLRQVANIPCYTLPFNLLILPWLYWTGQRLADEVPSNYEFSLSAIGQVIFLPDTVPAVMVCAALLLSGIGMLGWAFVGAVITSGTATFLLVNPDYINFGLTGYNGVLAAVAMFWHQFKPGWSIVAAVLAGLMTAAMLKTGLPMLTMPFVLSCWLCLAVRSGFCYYQTKYMTDREKL
ncbi:urea transporter [Oceanisphaera sp. KMM 10153]|uniref:urea transporter n=1 Tax=Oceanisphaera submarina TaxID=3390193 RepID=UPI003975BDA5